MIITEYQIQRIKWRLINDAATNLSDEEIERVFSKTCTPTPLIKAAKILRDKGLLNLTTTQDNQLSIQFT
jgi:hypothetical protein